VAFALKACKNGGKFKAIRQTSAMKHIATTMATYANYTPQCPAENYRLLGKPWVQSDIGALERTDTGSVSAGKLSRKTRFSMVEENNVRQGFLEHGNFLKLLSKLPDHVQPLVESL
jgi:hypothetical protein